MKRLKFSHPIPPWTNRNGEVDAVGAAGILAFLAMFAGFAYLFFH